MSARVWSLPAASFRAVAGLLSLLLVTGVLGLAAPTSARADATPLDPATPATVTADVLPTVQVNGVVWAQVVVGDTVYAAGRFTRARPAGAAPGTQETVRNNLLAFDIRTGQLITSFAPDLNGQALAIAAAPDGSRIYVGGDFTVANGQPRNRVAAYSTATGALVPDWRPSVSGQVRAIATLGTSVYLGGAFTAVGTTSRTRLAAVSSVNGALLPWAPVPGIGSTAGNVLPVWQNEATLTPKTDAQGRVVYDTAANSRTSNDVQALVVAGGKVIAAGRFDSLNGVKATGIGALDPVSGATRPFAVNQRITNQGANSAIWSLSTDGRAVYGTGFDYYGPGNMESVFAASATDGALLWASTCRGDTYTSWPLGGVVYTGSHVHQCGNIGEWSEFEPRQHRFAAAFSTAAAGTNGPFVWNNANFVGTPAPAMLTWWPTLAQGSASGQAQAAWSITGNDRYLVYGGEFPSVNGVPQQGLVRFALPGTAPGTVAPSSGTLTPTVSSPAPGTARVVWREASDPDNEYLTYSVYRDYGTAPVYQVTSGQDWWNRETLAFTDRGLTAGTHTYRVAVADPQGNRNSGSWASGTVSAGTTLARGYVEMARADGAQSLWSLGNTGFAMDQVGGYDLTVNGGVTRGQAGALAGDGDTAAALNGAGGLAATSIQAQAPQTFSLEAWVNTRTTAGGVVVEFGNRNSGIAPAHDRLVYFDRAGRLNFGVWQNANKIVTSPRAYNDGRWHHVVATFRAGSMLLYVDGTQVAARSDVLMGEPSNGYWRIGGGYSWEFAGDSWFNGRVDEVAVYQSVLPADRVAQHFAAGSSGDVPNLPPTAAFTGTTTDLTVALDASASADSDGTVTSWAWDLGDGTTATGRSMTHTYATPGTRVVRLTVTDDDGATATSSQVVTASAPPTGVGSIAADTFDREVTSGWGSAQVGGAWTVTGAAGSSTVTGGTGRLTAAPGKDASARLAAVVRRDVSVQASLALPALPTGGGAFASLAVRRSGANDYRVKLWYAANGTVTASLVAVVNGAERTLAQTVVPGPVAAGTALTVRLEAEGAGTTQLRAKVWRAGTAEPAAWSVSASDATAALQQAGGLMTYLYGSGSATTSATVRIDDLHAEPAGTVVVANRPPTAAFTATPAGLTVALDGSGSTDADGTVRSLAWDLGDGTTATGSATSHTYGAAGTYTVRLTVTDDVGATGTTTRQVTVTAPAPDPDPEPDPEPQPGPAPLAADAFSREVTGGWGTADVGGAWTLGGAAANASVTGGTGQLRGAAAQGTSMTLAALSRTDVAVQAQVTLPQAATGGGTYLSVGTQRVGATDYRLKLRFTAAGQVEVMLVRTVSGAETLLGGTTLAGSYAPGTALTVRFETSGTGTTTLAAKVWRTGTAEPAAWSVTRTDATAALQRPGVVFLEEYVSGSATGPSAVRVDDLWVGPAGSAPAAA
ncbi:PKD domain-containing protein [Geodermatophilus sp. SYSU D01062]